MSEEVDGEALWVAPKGGGREELGGAEGVDARRLDGVGAEEGRGGGVAGPVERGMREKSGEGEP